MLIARGTTGGVAANAANGSSNQSSAGSKASPRQMDRRLIGVAPGWRPRMTTGPPMRASHRARAVPPLHAAGGGCGAAGGRRPRASRSAAALGRRSQARLAERALQLFERLVGLGLGKD